MKKGARILLVVAGIIILGIGGVLAFERPIALAMFDRAMDRIVGRDPSADLPDGLHVYVCGSGSPMADPDRAGACLGVLAGRHALIFDVGSGSMRVLGRMGFPVGRTERLFLTHLHSDHFDGLGELMVQSWIPNARARPLPILGPPGTAELAQGFNFAYRIDSTYRTAHHGADVANPAGYGLTAEEIIIPSPAKTRVALQDGDLTVTAIRVSHDPVKDAYGYRVDYKGRSIAISGDTVYDPDFATAARGVDVMFHEAIDFTLIKKMEEAATQNGATVAAKVLSDIPSYHTTPLEAAKIAALAKARALVYYHTAPPMPSFLVSRLFLDGTDDAFSGTIRISADGDLVSLPTGTRAITYRRALN